MANSPLNHDLLYVPAFLSDEEQEAYFNHFHHNLAWQEESLRIYGRSLKAPRLMCWYGDSNAHYRYSGQNHIPLPWDPGLTSLKTRIEQGCSEQLQSNVTFNSVLANLYRTGQDSMGWHADDETELGPEPVIASISLGATRRFRIRHNQDKTRFNLDLDSGSLLVMHGQFQQNWQHSISKTQRAVAPRINLTFRQVRGELP